jgi:hypothetical protein
MGEGFEPLTKDSRSSPLTSYHTIATRYAQVSDAEKEACMGLKAVNDPAKSVLATFIKDLSTSGRVGLDGVAVQGQATITIWVVIKQRW